jgi:hypothetical protein
MYYNLRKVFRDIMMITADIRFPHEKLDKKNFLIINC